MNRYFKVPGAEPKRKPERRKGKLGKRNVYSHGSKRIDFGPRQTERRVLEETRNDNTKDRNSLDEER